MQPLQNFPIRPEQWLPVLGHLAHVRTMNLFERLVLDVTPAVCQKSSVQKILQVEQRIQSLYVSLGVVEFNQLLQHQSEAGLSAFRNVHPERFVKLLNELYGGHVS